jgi:formamidopyrimidine-DNA glycosylase
MPELPEVETMVRGIRADVVGRLIRHMEFCSCSRKPLRVTPKPVQFSEQVRDVTVVHVRRLAKRIILELDTRKSVVIEPRMTGLLLLADPPTEEHLRICWHFLPKPPRAARLQFWDRRGLGTVSLMDTSQIATLEKRLGIDALLMTLSDWADLTSSADREIKILLLDQSRVSGIGNLYASEILHAARIHPSVIASQLRMPQVKRLSEATHAILSTAIEYEGSTLGDGTYRNALNQNGSFQNHHRVYKRQGMRCLTCDSGKIVRVIQGQRSTFFCSRCQQPPRQRGGR